MQRYNKVFTPQNVLGHELHFSQNVCALKLHFPQNVSAFSEQSWQEVDEVVPPIGPSVCSGGADVGIGVVVFVEQCAELHILGVEEIVLSDSDIIECRGCFELQENACFAELLLLCFYAPLADCID